MMRNKYFFGTLLLSNILLMFSGNAFATDLKIEYGTMGPFDTRFYVEMNYPNISDKDSRFQDFVVIWIKKN